MAPPRHHLRPTFTRLLFRKLKEGRSINLVGLRGAGGSRTLSDLKELAQAEGITTILVNMNHYKYNHPGFTEAIQEQLLLPAGSEQKALPHADVSTTWTYHSNPARRSAPYPATRSGANPASGWG